MALPLMIRIVHEPNFRTKTIGRYADGMFYADIHGTKLDSGVGHITVMMHLFDHVGRHVRSDIRPSVPGDDAEAVRDAMIGELADVAFGDIAIRLFTVEFGGVRFGLVDDSEGDHPYAELYPQRLGFAPPFDGLYST
jgi:hypothetical protein